MTLPPEGTRDNWTDELAWQRRTLGIDLTCGREHIVNKIRSKEDAKIVTVVDKLKVLADAAKYDASLLSDQLQKMVSARRLAPAFVTLTHPTGDASLCSKFC